MHGVWLSCQAILKCIWISVLVSKYNIIQFLNITIKMHKLHYMHDYCTAVQSYESYSQGIAIINHWHNMAAISTSQVTCLDNILYILGNFQGTKFLRMRVILKLFANKFLVVSWCCTDAPNMT